MTEAERAYEAALVRIARARRSEENSFSFSSSEFSALETLPPEIAELGRLTDFVLMGTQVANLAPLAQLSGLTSLRLNQTQVADLTPIAHLTGMEKLDISKTPVANLTPIARMTRITDLRLTDTPVADLSPLSNMSELIWLDLAATQITDISALSELTNLEVLNLNETKISDLSAVANLERLIQLDVRSTPIADLRPARALKNLAEHSMENGFVFSNSLATRIDPKLGELAEIKMHVERGQKTLAYLNGLDDAAYDAFLVQRMAEEGIIPEAPPDRPAAPAYVLPESGPLQAIDTAPSGADNDQDQLDLLGELRDKSRFLINTLGRSNELAHLLQTAEKYQTQISKPLAQIGLKRLWSPANALRNAILADDRADRIHRDTDLLPPQVLAALKDLIETHGLFIMGFENARALEAQMRSYLTGPRDPELRAAAQALAAQMVQDRPGVEPEELDALEEDARTASTDSDDGIMAEVSLSARLWNMLRAAGVAAKRGIKLGAKGGSYTILAHDFIQFLIGNETLVMTYLRLAQDKAAEWLPPLLTAIRNLLGL